ncbi:MAG TPA: DUF167 domain-containing protein [Candidatus Paceibacterota bacterium]
MMLKVFVTPSAKRESVEEKSEGVLAITVKEPAQANHANTRVREIVAGRLGVAVGKVRIFTGHRSRSKIVSISD